jgi:hypothetical protein
MARATKAVTVSKAAPSKAAPSGSKSITAIDQELQNEVANLKNQIGQASGNKIKVEATGDFILPDGQNLGNELQLVVVDFATRHTFYAGPYNPNNLAPPECYAMGKELSTMAPESDSPTPQSDNCSSCPLNQFGSGSNGTSKACKNSRVLAVVVVDPEDPEASAALDAPLYTLELPPTAIKSFDGAVAYTARALAGPPVKAIYTVRAQNAGTYAKISFVDPLPNPDYAVHFARRSEVQDMLYRRPDFSARAARQPARNTRTAAPRRTSTTGR